MGNKDKGQSGSHGRTVDREISSKYATSRDKTSEQEGRHRHSQNVTKHEKTHRAKLKGGGLDDIIPSHQLDLAAGDDFLINVAKEVRDKAKNIEARQQEAMARINESQENHPDKQNERPSREDRETKSSKKTSKRRSRHNSGYMSESETPSETPRNKSKSRGFAFIDNIISNFKEPDKATEQTHGNASYKDKASSGGHSRSLLKRADLDEEEAGKAVEKQWLLTKQFAMESLANILCYKLKDLDKTKDWTLSNIKLKAVGDLRNLMEKIKNTKVTKTIFINTKPEKLEAIFGLKPLNLSGESIRKWSQRESEYLFLWMMLVEKSVTKLIQSMDTASMTTYISELVDLSSLL